MRKVLEKLLSSEGMRTGGGGACVLSFLKERLAAQLVEAAPLAEVGLPPAVQHKKSKIFHRPVTTAAAACGWGYGGGHVFTALPIDVRTCKKCFGGLGREVP